MAYRRPGVRVTQEFAELLPALAPFNLPSCIVGPAYQVVQDDAIGTYIGQTSAYSYVSLNAGNIVDTAELNENELKDHQYPITVELQNIEAILEDVVGQGYAEAELTEFKDITPNAFSEVVEGDILTVKEDDIEINAPVSNGTVATATPSTLVGANVTEFADVKVGDKVTITGGTDVTAGQYTVDTKTDDQNIILDSNFYTGGASSSDVAYQIDRTTGTNNVGRYIVREVKDFNTLVLQSELKEVETMLSYNVLRKITSAELERDSHFTADGDGITLLANIQINGLDVDSADVVANYRALRTDLAAFTREYKELADVQAEFGVTQVVPANPLAFGIALGLQNTVTAVNGLGLGAEYLTNEQQAYQKALDVLKKTEMYALTPLTQDSVVAQLFSSHITQMSAPDRSKERVAITNRKLITIETLVDTTTTSGRKVIVNTQTTGIVILGASTLSAATEVFINVQPGDVVTIVSGTGVTPNEYIVDSKDSNTQITLAGFTATYNGGDIAYYIERDYGVESDGITFYDGDAEFIVDQVSSGDYLVIESGTFAGRYKITSVASDQKILVTQIPGIISVQAPITYRVERDMTNLQIAEFMKGYASSFSNRRLVVTFPDTVKIPEGSIVRELPGFYLGCSVAALTTGLPTQQGFTNLSVSGYLGFVNGSDKFDDDELDIIADGGVMIFDQEVPEAPLYIRHELTTDRSSIKFQEYMVTKNVDFIAKFMRNSFKTYIGQYNIVDSTFDSLKTQADAVLRYLRDETVVDKLGGIIKSGNLQKLEEGTNIDTILMRFKLDIPIPLNNIDITVQV